MKPEDSVSAEPRDPSEAEAAVIRTELLDEIALVEKSKKRFHRVLMLASLYVVIVLGLGAAEGILGVIAALLGVAVVAYASWFYIGKNAREGQLRDGLFELGLDPDQEISEHRGDPV